MKKRELKDKVIDLQNQLRGSGINHARQIRKLESKLRKEYNKGKAEGISEVRERFRYQLEKYQVGIKNTIFELEVENDSLKNRIKELESSKPTLGDALSGVESGKMKTDVELSGIGTKNNKLTLAIKEIPILGIKVPIEIQQKHGKEIESLISTLERCKAERKRFEYELNFETENFDLECVLFGKQIIYSIYDYPEISNVIAELTTLFLSEKVSEKLLDLMFEREGYETLKPKTSWFFEHNSKCCEIYRIENETFDFKCRIRYEYFYFTTSSELETILIENNIEL